MAATVKPVRLPTDEEYDQAFHTVARGYDAVEAITWRLDKLAPHVVEGEKYLVASPPDRLVTAADVGMLWSFLDSLRTLREQTHERVKQLEGLLAHLDHVRREPSDAPPLDEWDQRDAS